MNDRPPDDSHSAGASGASRAEGARSRTSTSLLEAAKRQAPEGWRRLVAEHQSRIYRWCRRAGLDEFAAADVSQEVFLAVARGLDDFRRDRPGDSFRKWLRAITTHKIQDHWRRKGKQAPCQGGTAWQKWLEELAGHADPSTAGHAVPFDPDDPRILAIQQVRAETNGRDWTIFEKTVVDELPPAEVAEQLGVSVNVVYLTKSRVLKRVRACFPQSGDVHS